MKKIIILLALAALVTGGSIAFMQYNQNHPDLAKIKADHIIGSTALFDSFSKDENNSNEKYLNKVLEVTGRINKIDQRADGTTQVFLESGDDMFGVICDMDTLEDVSSIKVGDEIKIKGTCSGYLMDVALNRCIVIN